MSLKTECEWGWFVDLEEDTINSLVNYQPKEKISHKNIDNLLYKNQNIHISNAYLINNLIISLICIIFGIIIIFM